MGRPGSDMVGLQMMKILFIQPPIEDFYTTPIRLYPLGLLYAARVATKMGIVVEILDCLTPLKKRQLALPHDFAHMRPYMQKEPLLFQHYFRFGLPLPAVVARIKAARPDLIGISAQFSAYHKSVADLAAAIKEEMDTPVFIGGNHATVMALHIDRQKEKIDTVLKGPAESCLPPFLATLNPSLPARKLDWKGLTPDHGLLTADHYRIGRRKYISLIGSRGCPHGCDFCSVEAMFGSKIEYRAIEDVIAEMRLNYLGRDVRLFNFEDDNIAVNTAWFSRFLEAVCTDDTFKDIELTAMNGITYAHLDESVLALMKRAGFKRLNLSYVTHSRALRKVYRRPKSDNGSLAEIVLAAKKYGLMVTVYLIIGLPDQTYEEIKESIDYLLGLGVLVGPSVFYIPPGSRLYDNLDLPTEIYRNWNLYRSSAFAVETRHLTRAQLVELFVYARRQNLKNRVKLSPA